MDFLPFYLGAGVITGLVSGLFGVGGGIVMIPVLTVSFRWLNINPEISMHMALGTSLAAIIVNSLFAVISHSKKKAIQWKFLLLATPGIATGSLAGAFLAADRTSKELGIVFIVFLFLFTLRLFFASKPQQKSPESSAKKIPSYLNIIMGFLIGLSSAFLGVGGGVFTSAWLLYLRYPVQHALATSSGAGLPVSIMGTAGYIWNGLEISNLPQYSLGFVYLPALLGLIVGGGPAAWAGAKLAHKIEQNLLKKIFGVFLLCMAVSMLYIKLNTP